MNEDHVVCSHKQLLQLSQVMKRYWLQLLLRDLWNGETINLAPAVKVLFVLAIVIYPILTTGTCPLYSLIPLCSYCQRIGRSDFWGGESELLVSTVFLRQACPVSALPTFIYLFFSFCLFADVALNLTNDMALQTSYWRWIIVIWNHLLILSFLSLLLDMIYAKW